MRHACGDCAFRIPAPGQEHKTIKTTTRFPSNQCRRPEMTYWQCHRVALLIPCELNPNDIDKAMCRPRQSSPPDLGSACRETRRGAPRSVRATSPIPDIQTSRQHYLAIAVRTLGRPTVGARKLAEGLPNHSRAIFPVLRP